MNGGCKRITSKEFRGFRWNGRELSAYGNPRRSIVQRSIGHNEMVRLFDRVWDQHKRESASFLGRFLLSWD